MLYDGGAAAATSCCFCCCCFQEDAEAAEDACDADEGAEAAEEEAPEEDECLGDDVESEEEKDKTRGTFKDISALCSVRFPHYSHRMAVLDTGCKDEKAKQAPPPQLPKSVKDKAEKLLNTSSNDDPNLALEAGLRDLCLYPKSFRNLLKPKLKICWMIACTKIQTSHGKSQHASFQGYYSIARPKSRRGKPFEGRRKLIKKERKEERKDPRNPNRPTQFPKKQAEDVAEAKEMARGKGF